MICLRRMVRLGMGRYEEVVPVGNGAGALLLLPWKVKAV